MVNGISEDKTDFIDMYIDASGIKNFYIPETEHYEGACINFLYEGHMLTVRQTPNILKYLSDNLVKKAI